MIMFNLKKKNQRFQVYFGISFTAWKPETVNRDTKWNVNGTQATRMEEK